LKRFGVLLLLATCLHCGAYDVDAQPVAEPPDCPDFDERLSGLTNMVESGELSGLKEAIEQDISPGIKTRLIAVILDLMNTVDPNALDDVGGLMGSLDEGVLQSVADGVRPIVDLGDPAYQAIGVVGTVLHDCTGKPLLTTLIAQLREPVFRSELELMGSSDGGMLAIVEELGLDLTKPEGRVGFVTFMRALVAYVSRPDFKVSELTGDDGIMGAMASDETPNLNILIRILDLLMASPSDLQAVQTVTTCFLAIDTDDQLLGLAFDVLHAQALVPKTIAPAVETDSSITGMLDSLVLPLLDRLVADDALRHSLVIIVAALVHPDVVAKVLPDVVALIEHGVILDIIDLFVDMGSGLCQEASS